MKKILVILVICFLTFPVWAAKSAALTSELEAEAGVLFGVDLGNDGSGINTGIETSASFTYTLALVETSTEELGEAEFYGWIEIKDFEITLNGGSDYPTTSDLGPDETLTIPGVAEANVGIGFDWGEINAKIVMGDLYIDLTSNEAEVDKVSEGIFNINGRSMTSQAADQSPMSANVASATGFGFGIGYNFMDGNATVELGLSSAKNKQWYKSANEYLVHAYLSMSDIAGSGVGIDFGASQWLNTHRKDEKAQDSITKEMKLKDGIGYDDADLLGATTAGIKVDYSYPINDNIILKPAVGADVMMSKKTTASDDYAIDLQFAGAVNLVWPGIGTDGDDVELSFFSEDTEVTSGVGLGASYSMTKENANDGDEVAYENRNYMDVYFGFYEDSGDAGLIPGLGAQLLMNYTTDSGQNTDTNGNKKDAVSMAHLGIGAYIDYKVAEYFTPFVGVIYQIYNMGGTEGITDGAQAGLDEDVPVDVANMELTLGLKIDGLIPNTSMALTYESANLLGEDTAEGDDLTKYVYFGKEGKDRKAKRDFFHAGNFNGENLNNFGIITFETTVSF